jgi:hypothetical protein
MQCAAVFSAGSCGDVCPPIPNPRLLTCGAAVPKVFNRSNNLYVYVTVEIVITMGTKFAALIYFGPALHLPFTRACRITHAPKRTRPSTKQHYISHTPASITHSTRRITRKSVLVSVCTSGRPPTRVSHLGCLAASGSLREATLSTLWNVEVSCDAPLWSSVWSSRLVGGVAAAVACCWPSNSDSGCEVIRRGGGDQCTPLYADCRLLSESFVLALPHPLPPVTSTGLSWPCC